jgi:uroporphyrinogen decarboxylase
MMNDRFLKAAKCEPVDIVPVWFMRQAGRYLKEYSALRKRYSFEEMCRNPELAVKVAMLPVQILEVDAAILFCDLLTPAWAMGFEVIFEEGRPFVTNPIRTESDVSRVRLFEVREELSFVMESVKILRRELSVPLIGFAGGPFTLASYLVEGAAANNYAKLKNLLNERGSFVTRLFEVLTELSCRFLEAQIEAGVNAVQIFETWAGTLSQADFERFTYPFLKETVTRVKKPGVPVIIYVNGVSDKIELLARTGADVISVDWRIDIGEARKRAGNSVAIQGNLDPSVLLQSEEVIVDKTREILDKAAGTPGFIFNLGHGILPETDVKKVKLVVETVHNFSP